MVSTSSTGILRLVRLCQISKLSTKTMKVLSTTLSTHSLKKVSLTMVRTTLKLQRRVLKRCLVTLLLLFTHQTNATRIWLVRWFAYHLLVARFLLSPTNTLTQSLVQEWLRLRQPTTLTTLVLVTATTWSVSTQ